MVTEYRPVFCRIWSVMTNAWNVLVLLRWYSSMSSCRSSWVWVTSVMVPP